MRYSLFLSKGRQHASAFPMRFVALVALVTDTAGEFPLSDTSECRNVGDPCLGARFVGVPVHPPTQVERHGRPNGLQVHFGYPYVARPAQPERAYGLRDRPLHASTLLLVLPECLGLLIEAGLLLGLLFWLGAPRDLPPRRWGVRDTAPHPRTPA